MYLYRSRYSSFSCVTGSPTGEHPPVAVVCRAGSLRRHHRGAKRALRRTARPKGRTLVRLLDALENQPAETIGRLIGRVGGQLKTLLCVKRAIAIAQPKPTVWDRPDPAPLARHDLKHLADQLLRRKIPLAPDRACILVF